MFTLIVDFLFQRLVRQARKINKIQHKIR